MDSFLKNLFTVFPVNRRRKVYAQVRHQRSLAKTGEAATAQVIEIAKVGHGIYNYVRIRVGMTIQSNSETVFREMSTLANKDSLPKIGEIIPIRFSPDDVSGTMVIAK